MFSSQSTTHRQRMLLQLAVLMVAATVGALSTGCAEERPAINRVQPFALKKAHFVGDKLTDTADDPEFWTQATLVDVGYGAAQDGLFTSTYAQPMTRIKWQITEDLLIGRLAYERIDSSDGKGLAGPTQEGVIVAAFRIDSHFDVVNSYNSTTGEKLNILEENSFDRPWYEREYFRVDWSQNLNTDSYDFDTLSQMGVYGGIKYEPMRYDITDPNDPHAAVFDLETGYFDVTNKAFAQPQMIDLSHFGWGIDAFPACYLDPDFMGGSGPDGTCNPVELTIRHSFRKVEDTDYEPQDWDGYRFSAFGAFTEDRYGYSRNYGLTDDRWVRMIARYNIWDRSHYYADSSAMTGYVACATSDTTPFGADPNRDDNADGTSDECQAVTDAIGVGGSQCDVYKNRCTLPYQERLPRPIVWYYTTGSSPHYFEPTRDAAHEWDVAFRTAVQSAKYSECMKLNAGGCATRFPMYTGQQDENSDAIALAAEVDNCREGLAHTERNRDEAQCAALADEIGVARGYSAGVISIAKMPEMLVLCHSPVEAGDPALCGEQRLQSAEFSAEMCQEIWKGSVDGLDADAFNRLSQECANARNVRMGDLRYHAVNVIQIPQTPSPWGIMTDANDPLTGETISASINVWSHVNDLWSQKTVDVLRYIDGELSDADITDGTHIRKWSEAAKAAASGGGTAPMDLPEVNQRIADFSGVDAASVPMLKLDALPDSVQKDVRALHRQAQDVRASFQAPSAMRPIYNNRAAHAHGSSMEAQLMTPMVQQMMGIEGLPLNDQVLDRTSFLRGANPSVGRDLMHWKENALAERGACILQEASAPFSYAALSDVLQEKFGAFNPNDPPNVQQERAEKMRDYLARRAQYAVIIHEMGHSVGLRHNFVSSSDAFGFRPQYWQLRTRNGQVTEDCQGLTPDGSGCIGPRYFDPVTEEEDKNLIWMFMQSSVMDYAGEPTQDTLGLGAYDFAATRMFYGETISVFADSTYGMDDASGRASGMLAKTDNFGGIVGMQWEIGGNTIHYSALQKNYDLIQHCKTVDPALFKPASWNEATDGVWHPVLDGHIVPIDGVYTRCEQQKVDYVPWTTLRRPSTEESEFYRGGGSITADGRVRVPYGFASDNWADLGNLSVYRHDNGADAYELFDFLISQQEVNHIFDNYRRNRTTFSVRNAAGRTLGRYNEKMRDAAKGLGLLRNIYVNFALEVGYDFETLWPYIANEQFKENILASGLAFDHFTRMLARPEHGPHYVPEGDTVLRSTRDATANIEESQTAVTIPNGATGYFGYVSPGGRPLENQLAEDKGDYDSYYTLNAGSYYDKLYTSMLLTESVDNFISSSRTDFLDPRYRAVSMADLFPEGYRRWLANFLTNDDTIRGPRLMADTSGRPQLDQVGYPSQPMGWTTWWGQTPRLCFPNQNTTLCSTFNNQTGIGFDQIPANQTAIIDPQVGWEQQKFLIAWTLLYLPENQQQRWLNSLRIWELGVDADPEIQNRIEFHHPSGKIYVARTEGTEIIFGKKVQKGIAARMLQYANELLVAAYETTPGPDDNGDGEPDWYLPVYSTDGAPIVKYDPTILPLVGFGFPSSSGEAGCNATENFACTCSDNRACMQLEGYVQLPFFLREAIDAYGLGRPSQRGIY